jgi:hypothetical protein
MPRGGRRSLPPFSADGQYPVDGVALPRCGSAEEGAPGLFRAPRLHQK